MDSLTEDYPQLLSNIADILSSDPILGATLLVSQNIDLDLFVYHLLDNYNEFKCNEKFIYHVRNNGNYSLGIYVQYKSGGTGYYYDSVLLDDIQDKIKQLIIKLINTNE